MLAGHPGYEVTAGEVRYQGEDLLELAADERARKGVFMAFQYPVEIPGVNNAYFLKAALNAKRKEQGLEELDAIDFMTLVKQEARRLHMEDGMLNRAVNEGFSGGEKKRNEIFHMAVLQPTLAILDETDSGLDIDALRIVSDGVNALRSPERSFIVVTHYQRLLEYIVPDHVHVLSEGRIVKSGGRELALELEAKGYVWLEGAAGGSAPVSGHRDRPIDWVRSRPARASARARPSGWPRTAPTALDALRGRRLPDHPARGVAVHQRRADRRHGLRAGPARGATAPTTIVSAARAARQRRPRPWSSTAASTSSCRPRRCRWASSSTGWPAASSTRTSTAPAIAHGPRRRRPAVCGAQRRVPRGRRPRGDSRGRGADRADPHPGGHRARARRR